MASYFDEHDCEPLGESEQPNHVLHLARLLIDTGIGAEWEMEYDRIFGGTRKAPPASKKAVEQLKTHVVTPSEAALENKCPVCIGIFDEEDEVKTMPCHHKFHSKCILPWLEKVNSCPLCRHELPTDDPDYEAYKKHKAREKQRDFEMGALHNSMFG